MAAILAESRDPMQQYVERPPLVVDDYGNDFFTDGLAMNRAQFFMAGCDLDPIESAHS